MSAALNPFGFRPAFHPSGLDRAKAYTIAAAYATAINKFQPVILNTNGTVTAGTAAADLLGVFAGVQYVDATGRPQFSFSWPTGGVTGATNIIAWVWDDPNVVYEVQADGSIPQTAIGDQADITNVSNQSLGLSTCTLSSTLAGAGVQAQWRIVGFGQQLDNTPGDAFTIVQVQLARHQYVANKVAI